MNGISFVEKWRTFVHKQRLVYSGKSTELAEDSFQFPLIDSETINSYIKSSCSNEPAWNHSGKILICAVTEKQFQVIMVSEG